jgi:hypothetical protein
VRFFVIVAGIRRTQGVPVLLNTTRLKRNPPGETVPRTVSSSVRIGPTPAETPVA